MIGTGIAAALLALAFLLGWLLWRARTSSEAVRLRKEPLFGLASESELAWRPDAAPPDFKIGLPLREWCRSPWFRSISARSTSR